MCEDVLSPLLFTIHVDNCIRDIIMGVHGEEVLVLGHSNSTKECGLAMRKGHVIPISCYV